MMPLTTDSLMQIALDMVGWETIPADSGIHVPGERIERLLVGLNVDSGDLLLARDFGYDGVLAHDYAGTEAELTAWQVYHRHIDLLVTAGIPRHTAEAAVVERIEHLHVASQRANYDRVTGAARLIGMPFLNIRSPVDELGRQAMQRTVDDLLRTEERTTAAEVCAHLNASFAEFQYASTQISIRLGDGDAPAGRTVVVHGALSNGGASVAKTYFEHGIDTVVYVHIAPQELQKLQPISSKNLIVIGRVPAYSIGLNIYLAQLEQLGIEMTRLNGVLPQD